MKGVSIVAAIIFCTLAMGACSPKVGSDKWCSNMKDKDKGDWTASETADYMKHCAF